MKKVTYISFIVTLVMLIGCSNGKNIDDPTVTTTSSTTSTTSTEIVNETETNTKETKLTRLQEFLRNISDVYETSQIILSFQYDVLNENNGKVFLFEKNRYGDYEQVLGDIEVVYGKNGLDKEKEGDKKSPSGVYPIPFAFGEDIIKDDLKIEYRITTENDYWVDDVLSDDYNTWQTFEGDPKEKWSSFERLKISSYKIALVIDYNQEREKGLGSAIFFHVWKDNLTYTSGCTATDESSLYEILKRLDKEKDPIIIQGSIEFFNNEFEIDIVKEILDEVF